MENIWILARANLRKYKWQTFSMLLLIMITAALLNIGLVLFFGIGSFFDERAEELNIAHFTTWQSSNDPINTQVDFVREFPGVVETETADIVAGKGGYYLGVRQSPATIFFASGISEHQMNPLALIGDSLPLIGSAIYIPHFLFLNGGYAIGDEIKLDFIDIELIFTVAGSTEEMMLGSTLFNYVRFYVSEQAFIELQSQFPDSKSVLLSARLTEAHVTDGSAMLRVAYMSEYGSTAFSYGGFRFRTVLPTIPAMFIVLFALILLIVNSIVIRFRINSDIEENMKNIGVLKAAGYTGSQIAMSIVLQYALIAIAGGVLGIFPSIIALPATADAVITPMLGLPWNPGFNLPLSLFALSLILLVVLLFAFVTSKRINKLHPIIALRNGITTHSFKKNPLPLDESRGSLNILLAAKQLFRNKKQAVMLCAIICGLTFSSVATLVYYYNINVNMDVFVRTVIGDLPDVSIWVYDADDVLILREWAENRPEVYSIYGRQSRPLQVDDYRVAMTVVEDFSHYTEHSLLKGRYPLFDNEIVLDNITLSTMGKSIGDWVIIRNGDYEYDYIITGSVQLMSTFVGMMNAEARRKIDPYFTFNGFGLYITGERADTDNFIEIIKSESGINAEITSRNGHINNAFGIMRNLVVIVSLIVAFVVAAVVILVLYLIIKTLIIRRKRELGTQKALGFTTYQLMNQIALNLTPAVIFGVILGTISGYIGFNPIFVAIMRGSGIAQANLPIPFDWIVIMSIAFILLSYAVSMMIAWRIRKITAYALVSEI